jgi:hypothetical protein
MKSELRPQRISTLGNHQFTLRHIPTGRDTTTSGGSRRHEARADPNSDLNLTPPNDEFIAGVA